MLNDSETKENESPQTELNNITINLKRKKGDISINLSSRNPISILNELKSGLVVYELLEQIGPSHSPIFKIGVVMEGKQYIGTGKTKKLAKCNAAEAALKSLVDNAVTSAASTPTIMEITSDKEVKNDLEISDKAPKKEITLKGPVMLLNELYPVTKYECKENEADIFARFKITASIDGEIFVGTGSSKKLAKNAAATAALSKLLSLKPGGSSHLLLNCRPTNISNKEQEFADTVGRLICDKFAALMENDLVHSKRKVLAGIVMSDGMEQKVVSVATGTKCVLKEHTSIVGDALNDMHAEIISRRCLKSFFFDQLQLLLDPNEFENSIFESRPAGLGYKLKDNITFHLYINIAPCGDARIFSPHEDGDSCDHNNNKHSKGQLRNKIESGEGTIPVNSSTGTLIWDSLIQAERLFTMSCSDKIARWNVLGLQGAILSNFVEPIYLNSIILGSLFREKYLYRAVCGRIENTLQDLSPPYQLNRPKMYLVTSTEQRHPAKSPNFSVNWIAGQDFPEVVNTHTGKPEAGKSRICKQAFAQKFKEICGKISSLTGIEDNSPTHYCAAKDVSNYKSSKDNLFQAFMKAELGCWVQKPSEPNQFCLDINANEESEA